MSDWSFSAHSRVFNNSFLRHSLTAPRKWVSEVSQLRATLYFSYIRSPQRNYWPLAILFIGPRNVTLTDAPGELIGMRNMSERSESQNKNKPRGRSRLMAVSLSHPGEMKNRCERENAHLRNGGGFPRQTYLHTNYFIKIQLIWSVWHLPTIYSEIAFPIKSKTPQADSLLQIMCVFDIFL